MVFVDAGGWYASVIPTDPDHAAATAWLSQNQEALITTDYIVDETLTLLRVRGLTRMDLSSARNSALLYLPAVAGGFRR
jgi:predicted nucleic acid-binding protein